MMLTAFGRSAKPRLRRLAGACALFALVGGCAITEALPVSPYPGQLYGSWAVSQEYCAEGWWRFSADRIETAGEMRCDVDNIYTALADTPIATYALSCLAEGQATQPSWEVTLQDHDLLEIDRHDGSGPIELIRCGPPPGTHTAPQ